MPIHDPIIRNSLHPTYLLPDTNNQAINIAATVINPKYLIPRQRHQTNQPPQEQETHLHSSTPPSIPRINQPFLRPGRAIRRNSSRRAADDCHDDETARELGDHAECE